MKEESATSRLLSAAEGTPSESEGCTESNAETRIEQTAREIADLRRKIQELQDQLQMVDGLVRQERHRVDCLLADREGIMSEIDLFHERRRSEGYQKVFTSRRPLVSVLICTTDRCDLLVDRCIKSIQSQTYDNLQVIVVGDHCMDDTEARVAELRDSRIVFRNLPRRGPYPRPGMDRWRVAGTYADNEALKLVEGDFVTYLDDDDAYAPERIETLVEAAQREKADFVWHPFFMRQRDGDWRIIGDGALEHAQVGLGMVMYHSYLRRIQHDLYAYRLREPGDWNLIRKLKALRPHMYFVDKPLTFYYKDWTERPFVAQPGEEFLE